MINGSSQGLFVIVAVVIFGIFVVISYLLFRDKLQTGLANIFEDSINESTSKNNNILKESDFKSYNASDLQGTYIKIYNYSNVDIVANNSTKNNTFGLQIYSENLFVSDVIYKLSYDITMLKGALDSLGGHLGIIVNSENRPPEGTIISVKLNGKEINSNYVNKDSLITGDFSEGTTNNIEVTFKATDGLESNATKGIFIQPNRHSDKGSFIANVSNLSIVKQTEVN